MSSVVITCGRGHAGIHISKKEEFKIEQVKLSNKSSKCWYRLTGESRGLYHLTTMNELELGLRISVQIFSSSSKNRSVLKEKFIVDLI